MDDQLHLRPIKDLQVDTDKPSYESIYFISKLMNTHASHLSSYDFEKKNVLKLILLYYLCGHSGITPIPNFLVP